MIKMEGIRTKEQLMELTREELEEALIRMMNTNIHNVKQINLEIDKTSVSLISNTFYNLSKYLKKPKVFS
jgi:hypothetical protein